jgi:hypothetical protein
LEIDRNKILRPSVYIYESIEKWTRSEKSIEKAKQEKGGPGRWKMKGTAAMKETNQVENIELRHYFYSCPGLDLWAVGRTREEAERRLKEEIAVLLTRCSKYNPLDKLLEDRASASLEVRPS